jgi:hypothetical protein
MEEIACKRLDASLGNAMKQGKRFDRDKGVKLEDWVRKNEAEPGLS